MKKYILVLLACLFLLACENTAPELKQKNLNLFKVSGKIIAENLLSDSLTVQVNLLQNSTLIDSTLANSNLNYSFTNLAPGNYAVQVAPSKLNWRKQLAELTILYGQNKVQNFSLNYYQTNASLSGTVSFIDTEQSVDTIIDIVYILEGYEYTILQTVTTDANGNYNASNLFAGDYRLDIKPAGYEAKSVSVTLFENSNTAVNNTQFGSITIDGTIESTWGTSKYVNTNESSWSTSNNFDNVYLAYDEDYLYIAVSGGFSSGSNCVNLYIDTDYGTNTGINDFNNLAGGSIGNNLKRHVTCAADFGADFAFSSFKLSENLAIVSLTEPDNIDANVIEQAQIGTSTEAIEIAIPLTAIFTNGVVPAGSKLAICGIIGSDNIDYMANDAIPQEANFTPHPDDANSITAIEFNNTLFFDYSSFKLGEE